MAKRTGGKARVALITGAAGGLGSVVTRALAARGCEVILAGPAREPVRKLAEEMGTCANALTLDVADERSIGRARAFVERRFGGRVDILVNCAGIDLDEGRSVAEGRITRMDLPVHDQPFGYGRSVLDADMAVMRATLEVNTMGPLRLCGVFVPGMIARGYGRVVNVSSMRGQLASMEDEGTPAYQLSKAALNAVTRMVADAARGTNVLVNSVCPGWSRTSLGGKEAPRSAEEGADSIIWAATLPASGPTGGFFRDRRRIAW